MPRVSLVGSGHNGAEDYATGDLWWAAESIIDYGAKIEAICKGDCGALDADGGSINGYLIDSDGVEYDGTNHLELPLFERINMNSNDGIVRNFRVYQESIHTPLSMSGNDTLAENFHISFGVGASSFALSMLASVTNRVAKNFILDCTNSSRTQAIQTGYNRAFTATNYLVFGSETGCPGSAGDQNYINGFSFNNSSADYGVGTELISAASEDLTGLLGWTGYTSEELVDFEGGDYRTKSTSDLADDGEGGFIGAFIESSSSAGVSGDANFDILPTDILSSGESVTPQPVGDTSFNIGGLSFSGDAQSTLPRPVGNIDFHSNPVDFVSSGSATIPSPDGSVAFDILSSGVTGHAESSAPYPVGNIEINTQSVQFIGSGDVTQPSPSGDIGFSISSLDISSSGSTTLPDSVANSSLDVSAVDFSSTGSSTFPTLISNTEFDMGDIRFQSSGLSTQPQPSGEQAFDIEGVYFEVSGSVTGFLLPCGSTITLQSASNTIPLIKTSNLIALPKTSNLIKL